MAFLVAYVVPQVATIFEQQHAALPLATRILITFSGLVTGYWIPLVLLLVGMVAGFTAAMATPRGRRMYDTAILKVYYIGPTMIRIICARFARTLATLLASGVQLLPALDAVKGVVTNGLLKDAVEQSRESIREGHGMGADAGAERAVSAAADRDDPRRRTFRRTGADARAGRRQLRA